LQQASEHDLNEQHRRIVTLPTEDGVVLVSQSIGEDSVLFIGFVERIVDRLFIFSSILSQLAASDSV
jgi:hypothetical protein